MQTDRHITMAGDRCRCMADRGPAGRPARSGERRGSVLEALRASGTAFRVRPGGGRGNTPFGRFSGDAVDAGLTPPPLPR
jgi:hypothetical protein